MSVNKWLKILIPVQLLSLIIQPITGFGYAATDSDVFEIIHISNGILFLTLIAIHIWINRGWFKGAYLKHPRR